MEGDTFPNVDNRRFGQIISNDSQSRPSGAPTMTHKTMSDSAPGPTGPPPQTEQVNISFWLLLEETPPIPLWVERLSFPAEFIQPSENILS